MFDAHVDQAKQNMRFLGQVSQNMPDEYGWQVTIAFYVAVHLIQAHIVKTVGVKFKNHSDVDELINPFGKWSCKLDESTYNAYRSLYNHSRRSRYLYEKKNQDKPSYTYKVHVARSLRNLQIVLNFITDEYDLQFESIKCTCKQIQTDELTHFRYTT